MVFLFGIVLAFMTPLFSYGGENQRYIFLVTNPESNSYYTKPISSFELSKTSSRLGFDELSFIETTAISNDLSSIHKQTLELAEKHKPKKIFILLGLGSRVVTETLAGLPWYESICPIRHMYYFKMKRHKEFLNIYISKIDALARELKNKNIELNIVFLGGGVSTKILNNQTGFCGYIYNLLPAASGIGISPDVIVEHLSKVTLIINSPMFSAQFLDYNRNKTNNVDQLQNKLFEILLPAL